MWLSMVSLTSRTGLAMVLVLKTIQGSPSKIRHQRPEPAHHMVRPRKNVIAPWPSKEVPKKKSTQKDGWNSDETEALEKTIKGIPF